MADTKISALTELTTISDDDVYAIVDDPTGTAVTKYTKASTQRTYFGLMSAASGTDADTTAVANSDYTVDLSAWATANRTYTLPASPSVGNKVGFKISAGNATYSLIIVGNTSQTIDGGSAASEWSRLRIAGERVVLEYVATNKWVVTTDKRRKMEAIMRLTTSADGETAAAIVPPIGTSQPTTPGAWTADLDVGSVTSVSTSTITVFRACNILVNMTGAAKDAQTAAQYFMLFLYKNGAEIRRHSIVFGATGTQTDRVAVTWKLTAAAGDAFQYRFRTEAGGIGLQATSGADSPTTFSITETF
jgi:hypothetical protein